MHMFGGHFANALAVGMREWTCLIEMAMLVAPPAVVPDLVAKSGFKPIMFLSLLQCLNFSHCFSIALGYV